MQVKIEVKRYKTGLWAYNTLSHEIEVTATAFWRSKAFCAIEFGKVNELEQLKQDAVNRMKRKIEDYKAVNEAPQLIEEALGIEFREIEIEGE